MAELTVREILEEQLAVEKEAPEVTEVEKVSPVEADIQKDNRSRDENGKFAKAQSNIEKTELNVNPENSLEQKASDETAVELPPLQRPSSWKKELWPVWDKMSAGQPLTAQESRQLAEYNNNREQQFASGVSTYKQEAERAKPIFEAIAPYQSEFQKYGVEAPQVIRNLLAAQAALVNGSPHQKLNMLAQIAKDYGIPLSAFTDQDAQQQYLATPHTPRPQPQIDINQAVMQAIEQRELQQTIKQVESNTEKYPFFPYVRNSMAQLLEAGDATDLDDAYQRALTLPEHSMLSTAMQQQQSAADEHRRIEAAQKAAKVARANTLSPKSATPTIVNGTGKTTSVRDALVEAMSAHGAGGRV